MMEKYSAKRDGKQGWIVEAPVEFDCAPPEFAARMVKDSVVTTLFQYSFYADAEGRVVVWWRIETPDYRNVLDMYCEACNLFGEELKKLDQMRRVCRSEVAVMKKGESDGT